MMRSLVAIALLAASLAGCASGYVTYYEPAGVARGGSGREVPHADPYTRPPPPAGVELAGGAVAVSCTNLRKFVLLPIPWFRRGFRPMEYEIELAFRGAPGEAVIDTAALALKMDGKTLLPSRVAYRGERPAPVYLETIELPTRARYKLSEPRLVILSFKTDAREAKAFELSLGEVIVDGTRTLLPPLRFSREGQFVAYHFAEKNRAPRRVVRPGDDPLADL
jgi:hypothetical protein